MRAVAPDQPAGPQGTAVDDGGDAGPVLREGGEGPDHDVDAQPGHVRPQPLLQHRLGVEGEPRDGEAQPAQLAAVGGQEAHRRVADEAGRAAGDGPLEQLQHLAVGSHGARQRVRGGGPVDQPHRQPGVHQAGGQQGADRAVADDQDVDVVRGPGAAHGA